jgi:DNA-binding transcriptional MocR family regulator
MHSATICEVAFRKYLELGVLDSHLDHLRKLNRERRQHAYQVIRESFPADTKVWQPLGGFLLWAELPAKADIGMLYRAALAESVAFCQGTAFFTADNASLPAMRLNCSRPTKEQLTEGLQILGKLLRKA